MTVTEMTTFLDWFKEIFLKLSKLFQKFYHALNDEDGTLAGLNDLINDPDAE